MQKFPLDPHRDPHGEMSGRKQWNKQAATSSFLDKKTPQSLIQQGLEGSTVVGKDEVGGSNPPSSSIETLESVGIQGFSIFFQFVEKQHIPTLLPTNICSGQFFCIAAISSLAISGLF